MPAKKGNKYAKGNKGGAPTKYDKKYCVEIIKFFDIPVSKSVKKLREYTDAKGKKRKRTIDVAQAENFPTLERFAFNIGCHPHTLLNWSEKHEEFLDALKKAKALQKDWLIRAGLSGYVDKTFAIFTAKNVTDMRDRTEHDISGEMKHGVVILPPLLPKKKKS